MPDTPLVSIVTATYNRSRVLAHAIASVRRSSRTDWELIVVGDHCTDDTADVVASFGDSRISFTNLPANIGEQSGPNNVGVARAKGRFIAFLNHDDLHFPDHLELSLAQLQRTSSDFVWSPLIVALAPGKDDDAGDPCRFRLSGVTPGQSYDPRVFVFASSWVMTRELSARVGEWRPARDTFVTASQDWMFRAWRAGARMTLQPLPTVLAIPASARDRSYVGDSDEHEHLSARMRDDPRFRDEALAAAALHGERESNRLRFGMSLGDTLRALAFRPVGAAALALGSHPHAPFFALRYGRRGSLVNTLRKKTGLGSIGSP